MPLAWHYTTELERELGVYDLTEADVAYLKVVQSQREDVGAHWPGVFLLDSMRVTGIDSILVCTTYANATIKTMESNENVALHLRAWHPSSVVISIPYV